MSNKFLGAAVSGLPFHSTTNVQEAMAANYRELYVDNEAIKQLITPVVDAFAQRVADPTTPTSKSLLRIRNRSDWAAQHPENQTQQIAAQPFVPPMFIVNTAPSITV